MYSPRSHSSPYKLLSIHSSNTHSHSRPHSQHSLTHSLTQPFEKRDNLNKPKWAQLSLRNTDCKSETKELIMLGCPIGFSLATRVLQMFTDQAMVGHLGTNYLAASAMADILMGFFTTYIFAFCGAINVLCAQAFGAKNLPQVGEWLQLGCVLAAVLSIPTFFAYNYCEQVLLHFGASDDIAALSGDFARWSMISILPSSQFMAIRMYFKAQSNVLPATYICAVMVVFNLLANLILVYGYGINWITNAVNGTGWNGLGFIGSPIATAITRTMQYFVYVFYMFYWKKYHIRSGTWSSLKLSTFSCYRIKKFFAVAIPQTISTALEEWQLQIISLFASYLNDADLAAFSSSMTIIFLCHTIAIGLSDAVSVRVANFLGANNPKYAQYISWVGITIALVTGIVTGGLLASVGKYSAYIVSGKAEIFKIYQQVFPIIGCSIILMSVFTVIVGILIAQARTVGLAISALAGCWGISVPMSYLLGIYWHYGIRGIWYGVILGYTVFALSTFFIFFKTNWKQCAIDAVKRSAGNLQNDASVSSIQDIEIDEHDFITKDVYISGAGQNDFCLDTEQDLDRKVQPLGRINE